MESEISGICYLKYKRSFMTNKNVEDMNRIAYALLILN